MAFGFIFLEPYSSATCQVLVNLLRNAAVPGSLGRGWIGAKLSLLRDMCPVREGVYTQGLIISRDRKVVFGHSKTREQIKAKNDLQKKTQRVR